MADKITEQQRKEYQEAFDLFDENRDGRITKQELGKLMKALKQNPTDAQLADMIKGIDIDGDGKISFQEFLKMMTKKTVSKGKTDAEEEMREAFSVFDDNGDGVISKEELRIAMERLGEGLTRVELDAMLDEADIDGDGQVSYEEFVRLMKLTS